MPNKGAYLQAMATARHKLLRGVMPQPVSRKGLLALAPLGGKGPGKIWIRYLHSCDLFCSAIASAYMSMLKLCLTDRMNYGGVGHVLAPAGLQCQTDQICTYDCHPNQLCILATQTLGGTKA